MNPTLTEIRCCGCGRLLFKMEEGALSAALHAKCPRCKALNILRPQSPSPRPPVSVEQKDRRRWNQS